MNHETEHKRRPGHLTAYAKRRNISKPAAAKQLQRVGIDYMQEFDFDDADRRIEAARHADRAAYAKPIYSGGNLPGEDDDDTGASPAKDPKFAEVQLRKEHYKAELARLEYEQVSGKLVEKEQVETEAFRIGQQVRDAILNVPSRLAGIVAAESDQRKVHDLIEAELRQALEALANDDLTDDPLNDLEAP